MDKKHITLKQVYGYVKDQNDIIKLAKATKEDYDGMIRGIMMFDNTTSTSAVKQVFGSIAKDYTLENMKSILEDMGVLKIEYVNCTWKATIRYHTKDAFFSGNNLCDALWKCVICIL